MNQKSLKRLCAFLISDEQSVNSNLEILQGIIDSIFLKMKNIELTTKEISDLIKKETELLFSIDEIDSVVNSNMYVIKNGNEYAKFTVDPQRYSSLEKKKPINAYYYDFLRLKGIDEKNIDEHVVIFNKYLYYTMNNALSISSILDLSTEKQAYDVSSLCDIGETDRKLINDFLNLDQSEKNELLFKIITSGFEFISLNGCDDNSILVELGLSGKVFYLDTNIIFRFLGLNGKKREERVIQFLDKCIETDQKLVISSYTNKEFVDSLDYHSRQIEKYKDINSTIFSEYSFEEDFYKAYYTWKTSHQFLGVDSFIAEVNTKYEKLIKKYSIIIDSTILIETSDIQEKKFVYGQHIELLKRDIKHGVVLYDFETPDRSVYDAANIILIEEERKKEPSLKIPNNYLISADHYLIDWDKSRPNKTPIVLLPSHWLAVLVKYSKRTQDDYKAFIGFINLPIKNSVITNDQLGAILEGISILTKEEHLQETILYELVSTKVHKILKSKKTELIIERTVIEAKAILDKELEKYRKRQEETDEKFKDMEDKSRIKDSIIDKKDKEIEEETQKREKIHETLKRQIIKRKIKQWNTIGWLSLVPCLLFIYIIIAGFSGKSTIWNPMHYFFNLVDSNTSDAYRNYCYGFLLIPMSISIYFGSVFSKKILIKNNVKEMIDKINVEEEILKL